MITQALEIRNSTATETANTTSNVVDTVNFRYAVLRLDVTLLTIGAGEEVDFFVQTSYDGTNWADIENIHYANADNGTKPTVLSVYSTPTMLLDSTDAVPVGVAETDAALADDTKLNLPLGIKFRIRVVITNTPSYAYSAQLFVAK